MPRTQAKSPAASSAAARRRMQANRSRDTQPELLIRSTLHRRGLRFRVDRQPVEGVRRRADLVFPRAHIAVFIDGCFWHGCPEHGTWPKSNATFWREKIKTNQRRDADTDRRLRKAGWEVIRIWEHEEPSKAADRIERRVRRVMASG